MHRSLLIFFATMTLTWGDAVFNTPAAAELTGTRSTTDNQLIVDNDTNKGWTGFSISWDITSLAYGLWQYNYTFSDFDSPNVGHAIFELAGDCAADPACLTGAAFNGNPITGTLDSWSSGPGNSNPGMPDGATIFGPKFDVLSAPPPSAISFTSDRAPVYGNFYMKGGSSAYVYNPGLANSASTSVQDYIARPGDISQVPEPSSSALMLLFGVAGLAIARVRRRRQ